MMQHKEIQGILRIEEKTEKRCSVFSKRQFPVAARNSGRHGGLPLRNEQFVGFPSGGVVADIFADFGEVVFVSDDMFPIVALPEFSGKR